LATLLVEVLARSDSKRDPVVNMLTLLIVPVVRGQGTRLFPETGLDVALDLVDSRADTKGVTIQVYRPAGRPHYHPARPA
jgi:dihydrofolate reductase